MAGPDLCKLYMLPYLEKKIFAYVIKWKILRSRDHSGLSRCVLNAITSVPIRETQRGLTHRRGEGNVTTEARFGAYAGTSHGFPATTKRQGKDSLEAPEEVWLRWCFDFVPLIRISGFWAPEQWERKVSVVLNYQLFGDLLQQPQATNTSVICHVPALCQPNKIIRIHESKAQDAISHEILES